MGHVIHPFLRALKLTGPTVMAMALGVSRQMVSKMERLARTDGHYLVPSNHLRAIERATGGQVTVEDLVIDCRGQAAAAADTAASDMSHQHPLRAYRDSNNLSQEELANRLGVSRQMVGLIEAGARAITAKRAKDWEVKTGIPREVMCPEIFGTADTAASDDGEPEAKAA